MPEHFGTHMDAPAHFSRQGATVDQIPLQQFLSAAVVVDVTEGARSNSDHRVTVQDLEKWVKAHGPVPRGCLVFFRTGWAQRWPSQEDYMHQDARGVLHFPGLSVEAARYLLDHARPVGIGVDTASIDFGPSKNFEVHHLTLAAGLYHLENVANLDQLPATGTYVIALPLKLRDGSGSPSRVVALVPRIRSGASSSR
jgi:kynurenine formamidase